MGNDVPDRRRKFPRVVLGCIAGGPVCARGRESVMKKVAMRGVLLLALLVAAGCAGLRYSQVSPEAKDFHAARVGVMPVDVGVCEEARGAVDQIIAGVLVETKWFTDVVAGADVTAQMEANPEFRQIVLDYFVKLKGVNYSDPQLSARIGELLKVDAFLVTNVDYWNYTVENEDKLGKVGLAMKLIDARTGTVLWKAGHHIADKYLVLKPDLRDVAKDVAKKMVAEMPH
jgi:hypothetical protein